MMSTRRHLHDKRCVHIHDVSNNIFCYTLSYTAVGPANKIGYVPSTLSKMECTARYNNLIKNVYWLRISTQILNWMRTP